MTTKTKNTIRGYLILGLLLIGYYYYQGGNLLIINISLWFLLISTIIIANIIKYFKKDDADLCELCNEPFKSYEIPAIWQDIFLGVNHKVHERCSRNSELTGAKNGELAKFSYPE